MKKIFTVYDSKAQAFLQPFFAEATGLALRMFESAANDPEHDMSKWAADYTLFEVGTFDESTGAFMQQEAHINLGTALQFKTSTSSSSLPAPAETTPHLVKESN